MVSFLVKKWFPVFQPSQMAFETGTTIERYVLLTLEYKVDAAYGHFDDSLARLRLPPTSSDEQNSISTLAGHLERQVIKNGINRPSAA